MGKDRNQVHIDPEGPVSINSFATSEQGKSDLEQRQIPESWSSLEHISFHFLLA